MKFDVFGVGNALLDINYAVTEEFLQEHHLQKGRMALIDETTLAQMQAWPLPPAQMSSGGSAANSMMALAMLGGTAYYACQVAPDAEGQAYLNDLQKMGVQSPPLPQQQTYQGKATGRCCVFISPDAERTMYTYLGACTSLDAALISEEVMDAAQLVYLEGYLAAQEAAWAALNKVVRLAHKLAKPLALTFSDVNIIEHCRPILDKILQEKIAYLFCNEQEAHSFTGQHDLKQAGRQLLNTAQHVCITCGVQGAWLFPGARLIQAPQVKAIDTNGAGDMFAGCFLYGITHHWPPEKAAQLACNAAALLTTQPGARLSATQLAQQKAAFDDLK